MDFAEFLSIPDANINISCVYETFFECISSYILPVNY